MRPILVCVFALTTSFSLMAQAGANTVPAAAGKPVAVGKPVARVNGTVLTDRDLLREMYNMFPYARQHNGGFPKAMEKDIRFGALKMIEFEELVYQEAQRRKMTVPSAKLNRAFADFRAQFPDDEEFQQFLKTEVNGSQAQLRAQITRSLLIDQLLKIEIQDKSAVSPAQLKAFYDQNPDRFRTPESYQFQTISILAPKNAAPSGLFDVRKRAEEAYAKAKATKNYEQFGMLAEKISEDDYRVMMGDHKSVDRATIPPEVIAAFNRIQVGQVAELLKLGDDYCIVRLNGHTPPGKQTFDEAKKSLLKQLQDMKTQQLRSQLDRKLRSTAKVEEL